MWKRYVKIKLGVYYFPNGDKYDGDWKNNKMDGLGIIC